MRFPRRSAALLLFSAPLAWSLSGSSSIADPNSSPGSSEDQQAPKGGLVTLYAADDLACAFDFRAGTHGARIVEGEIDLTSAQIVFDALEPNMLSYGFVVEELVRVVDLESLYVEPLERLQDSALKYSISAIHTLFMDGARFAYHEVGGKVTRHRPANSVLAPMVEEGLRSFIPVVGNTYLIRFQGKRRGSTDQVAKFQVVDHEPRRWVTLRWAPLGTL